MGFGRVLIEPVADCRNPVEAPAANPVRCREPALVDPAIQSRSMNSDDFFGNDIEAKKALIGQGSTSGVMNNDVRHNALQKSRCACLETHTA